VSKRIGTVSIIITDRKAQAVRVNDFLSEYGNIIIGRMGASLCAEGHSYHLADYSRIDR